MVLQKYKIDVILKLVFIIPRIFLQINNADGWLIIINHYNF